MSLLGEKTSESSDEIIYISSQDVKNYDISLKDVRQSAADIFLAKVQGKATVSSKISLDISQGKFFQSLAAWASNPPIAVNKWLSVDSENSSRGLPLVSSLVTVNDIESGMPLAILEGNLLTALRTAAMSAVAAKFLANPQSTTLGLIGCGIQAKSHLEAFKDLFPGLRSVTIYGRTRHRVADFAEWARSRGFAAVEATTPQEAVRDMDLVVSSISPGVGLEPFIDPKWISPATFFSAVDLGRSLVRDGIREAFDLIATDDEEQSTYLGKTGRLAFPGPFDADLAALVSSDRVWRQPGRTALFLFAGSGLADLAVADVIYRSALAQGGGTRLAR